MNKRSYKKIFKILLIIMMLGKLSLITHPVSAKRNIAQEQTSTKKHTKQKHTKQKHTLTANNKNSSDHPVRNTIIAIAIGSAIAFGALTLFIANAMVNFE